jgi:hypothetical protein
MRCRRCWHVSIDDFITCPHCGRRDRRAVARAVAGAAAVVLFLVVWVVLAFLL